MRSKKTHGRAVTKIQNESAQQQTDILSIYNNRNDSTTTADVIILETSYLEAAKPELEKYDDYKIMILPDHPTPLALKTHTNDPVPFLIYQKCKAHDGVSKFCEKNAKETGVFIEKGPEIMKYFINL